MASGMYYRMYPNRILFKMYGFEKVDPEREQEIVNRLRRHTSSTSMNAADSVSGFDEEVIATLAAGQRPLKARQINHRILCPKGRQDVMKEVMAAKQPRMQETDVQRVFRRLQRNKTISSEVREIETFRWKNGDLDEKPTRGKEVTFQVGSQVDPKSKGKRPQSASGRLENQEWPDARTACRMFEEAQRERKFIQKLCRPTTATELKKKGFCYFCSIQKDQSSDRWGAGFLCQHCGSSEKDSKENTEKLRQQKTLVRRLRAPTRASEGGLPVCDKAPPDATVSIIGRPVEVPRRPLVSGLPRTRTIRGITARLNRPLSAPSATLRRNATKSPDNLPRG